MTRWLPLPLLACAGLLSLVPAGRCVNELLGLPCCHATTVAPPEASGCACCKQAAQETAGPISSCWQQPRSCCSFTPEFTLTAGEAGPRLSADHGMQALAAVPAPATIHAGTFTTFVATTGLFRPPGGPPLYLSQRVLRI